MMEFIDQLWTWYSSLFSHVWAEEGPRILRWGYYQVAFVVSLLSASFMLPGAWCAARDSSEIFENSFLVTLSAIAVGFIWPVLASLGLSVLGAVVVFVVLALPAATLSLAHKALDGEGGL